MDTLDIYETLLKVKDDPLKMEENGRKLIKDYINSLPSEERKKRAEQLQWNIDAQLHGIKDPITRMNKMVEIFWFEFSKFQVALNNLTTSLSNPEKLTNDPDPIINTPKATVIPLIRK